MVPKRIELLPKTMRHAGADGLKGWLRSTWLPYTQRVPESRRDDFLGEVVDLYLASYPIDEAGHACVSMVRLEVEAEKTV